VQQGRRIVVDVDLEKFSDRVSHEILIDRFAEEDRRRWSYPAGASLPDERRHNQRRSCGSRSRDAARRSDVAATANVLLDEMDKEFAIDAQFVE
jgi:RNA-directed DNA polymerase